MAGASFAVTSFLGGEWSQWAQGRWDRPDYRTALNVCLNMLPSEQGALVRRPGTQAGGTTRGGAPGRVIAWDFRQATPYSIEFTAGKLRFWTFTSGAGQAVPNQSGPTLATTNDDSAITSISTANPAVVTIPVARATWATGDSVKFSNLGVTCPLLQNRVFLITQLTSLTFSLQDAVTGANIDGSTLGVGSLQAGSLMQHIQEVVTPYASTTWQQVRLVQSELQAVLLHPDIPPQVVTVTPATVSTAFAVFVLAPAVFTDGPYLDPPTNGALLSPSTTSGSITFTLTFAAWSATVTYALNAFVNQSGTNYQSLVDQNLNFSPVSNPSKWAAVSAGKAVGPNGFTGADVGRLMRFQDSTGAWTWGKINSIANQIVPTTFAKIGTMTSFGGLAAAFDNVVSKIAFNCAVHNSTVANNSSFVGLNFGASPQKIDHGTFYPSNDIGLFSASYTYTQTSDLYEAKYDAGSIAVLTYAGRVPGAGGGFVIGDTLIGNTSGATGVLLNAPVANNGTLSLSSVTGNFLSGEACHGNASGVLTQCTAFTPPTLTVWVFQSTSSIQASPATSTSVNSVNMWGRNGAAPAGPQDGTLLGSLPYAGQPALLIPSSDTATSYQYVWFDVECLGIIDTLPTNQDQRNTTGLVFGNFAFNITYVLNSTSINTSCAQAQFFNPPGTGTGNGVVVEIFGNVLPNTSNLSVWRLGTWSNTTGWPACGTYHENRIWLAGAVSNRLDGSQSGNIFNFAPTQTTGQVLDSSAISATFSGPDVNALFWMMPDEIGIIIGTQAGDWVVRATTAGLPLTPSTMQAHRFSKIGCANIEPRRADHTIVMVQRFGRKLLELFADVFSSKLGAQNISWNSRHLTKPGIAEIAYQQELAPMIWSRQNDGTLFGTTYKRESNVSSNPPNFDAPHRHVFGSGRTVESITVGASVAGVTDTLAMVTNDPSTGIRHVEFLADIFEEGASQANAWFLDDADNPTSVVPGVTTCVLNGLTYLNGKLVTVFCGGVDCGDWTVIAGSITMTYGDGISAGTGSGLFTQLFARTNINSFVVGFTYNSDFQIVRPMTPQESGARNGPALGKRRRVMQFGALLENTVAISFGTSFAKLNPALFKPTPTAGTPLATGVAFNGVYFDTLTDEWSLDGMICGRISRPYSATIVALEGFIETSDK